MTQADKWFLDRGSNRKNWSLNTASINSEIKQLCTDHNRNHVYQDPGRHGDGFITGVRCAWGPTRGTPVGHSPVKGKLKTEAFRKRG